MEAENMFNTKIDDYFADFSSALLEFTNYYNDKIVVRILEEKKYSDEPYRFYYTILAKTNASLDTSSLLIRNFYNKPHFQPSLFVLLRSMVSDIIVAEYVSIVPKEEHQRKEIIHSIYSDHVYRTFNSISNRYVATVTAS